MYALSKVTRLEIIDHTIPPEEGGGRVYVKWQDDLKVEISLQDDDKTLKVFLIKKNEEATA